MGKKAIKWLYQELPKLISQGVLTSQTSDRLRKHYGEIKGSNKKIALFIICGAFGTLLIGLGIILLVGHNWENLPRFIRAMLSIALLVIGQAFALWVLVKRPKSHVLKESSATFLSLMVGASIALICQTYNIPGDAGTFTLTWMLLIIPLVYLLQASLPAMIYIIGITVWAGSYWHNPNLAILFWPLAALIIPHFIWSLRRELYTIRSTILSLVIAICVAIAASFGIERVWHNSWIIIYSSLYAIFYFLGCQSFKNLTKNWQKPLYLIGGIGIIILAFNFTFEYAWRTNYPAYYSRFGAELSTSGIVSSVIVAIMIIAPAILLFCDNLKRKNLIHSLFTALPVLSLFCYLLKGKLIVLPLLIFNAYLLILGISCIRVGNRNNSLSKINLGMLILAVLIMLRFFDSNIDFILKGLLFIAIGSGFLATNIMLIRRKGGAQ